MAHNNSNLETLSNAAKQYNKFKKFKKKKLV